MQVKTCVGEAVEPYLTDLARLRIAVFRDYPYLYEGDAKYEQEYLSAYARSADSVFVLALDGDRVVGVSSGIPLGDESESFQQPFRERDMAIGDVFYFGESVLLPAYRGRGLGHRFFDEREAHVRRVGRFRWTAFCSVERDKDDPRRPPDYRPNDAFWHKRGYQRQNGMLCTLAWKEMDDKVSSAHRLCFWLRALNA